MADNQGCGKETLILTPLHVKSCFLSGVLLFQKENILIKIKDAVRMKVELPSQTRVRHLSAQQSSIQYLVVNASPQKEKNKTHTNRLNYFLKLQEGTSLSVDLHSFYRP